MVFDFLDEKIDKAIKIYDDNFLSSGECLNIYGDYYSGKTSLCFNIIKNNTDKKIIYLVSEILDPIYLNRLYELSVNDNIYLLHCINIKSLINILNKTPVEIVIIDSLTAMDYIEEKKDIEKLFKIIRNKNINLIMVSQIREYNNQQFYEHKKILDFFSFKVKVEKNDDYIVLNGNNKIKLKEIWEQ